MKTRLTIIDAGVLVIFCILFAGLVRWFAGSTAPTFDETSHLTAGYTYLAWGDYRLNPEHPPLVKLWAALPTPRSHERWPNQTNQDESAVLRRAWKAAATDINAQWPFAHEFVFELKPEARDRLVAQDNFDPGKSWIPDSADLQRSDFVHDVDHIFL